MEVGRGTRDTGHGTRDTGHGTRDTGHGTQDTGHRTQDTGLDIGHGKVDIGQQRMSMPNSEQVRLSLKAKVSLMHLGIKYQVSSIRYQETNGEIKQNFARNLNSLLLSPLSFLLSPLSNIFLILSINN